MVIMYYQENGQEKKIVAEDEKCFKTTVEERDLPERVRGIAEGWLR